MRKCFCCKGLGFEVSGFKVLCVLYIGFILVYRVCGV